MVASDPARAAAELYFPYPQHARPVQLPPMKFPPLFRGLQHRGATFGLFAALTLLCARCSSSESPTQLQAQPSTPSGPSSPLGGESSTPDGTYGLPGPEPMSAPPEDEEPGATETNFLTPPCRQDSDCNAGRRCILGARAAADAGAATADAGDAGLASDAGVSLGFCERSDGG
jgi:hypothetical protein